MWDDPAGVSNEQEQSKPGTPLSPLSAGSDVGLARSASDVGNAAQDSDGVHVSCHAALIPFPFHFPAVPDALVHLIDSPLLFPLTDANNHFIELFENVLTLDEEAPFQHIHAVCT